MNIINKYKNTYKIVKQRYIDGKVTNNKDDTYIPARKNVQIYRFGDDILAVCFQTSQYAKNRVKELNDIGVLLTLFQDGDSESAYLFSESDLSKVADIVKARKKRILSEEQKEVLRERILLAREKNGK